MRDFSADHRWLSINTATLRGAGTLDRIVEACVRHGIHAISPWRDQVHAIGLERTSELVREHMLELSGYCRGGMFPALDAAGRQRALDDNRRAIDEARALDAACLVLVVGGLPGALEGTPRSKDLIAARNDVRDGIAATLEHARAAAMPLAIEPLHPMYAADRACVNTLEQALDLCEALDPSRGGASGADGPARAALGVERQDRAALGVEQQDRAALGVERQDRAALGVERQDRAALGVEQRDRAALGVAVDVYHVWWDPKLEAQIARAGRERLLAFHVCDWLVPTRDLLNDRGMMGDGVIDIPQIRGWVEAAGFDGYSEVEIFSSENWWRRPEDEVLATCIARHRSCV